MTALLALELVLVAGLAYRRRWLRKPIPAPAPVPAGPLSHVRLVPLEAE